METALRLLTRDGAIGFRFKPKLSEEQRLTLLKASTLAETPEELREAVKKLALEWHSDLEISE